MSELRRAVLAHYDDLLAVETPEDLLRVGFSVKTCPLCRLYKASECAGCPVQLRSGMPVCLETPYHLVAAAAWDFQDAPTPASLAELRAALRVERGFLAGLDYPA
jgi:hypothetical protein